MAFNIDLLIVILYELVFGFGSNERDIYIYRAYANGRMYQIKLYARDEWESLERLNAVLDFVRVLPTQSIQNISSALARDVPINILTKDAIVEYCAERNRVISSELELYSKSSLDFSLHSILEHDNKHECYFGRNCDENMGVFGSWDTTTMTKIFDSNCVIIQS